MSHFVCGNGWHVCTSDEVWTEGDEADKNGREGEGLCDERAFLSGCAWIEEGCVIDPHGAHQEEDGEEEVIHTLQVSSEQSGEFGVGLARGAWGEEEGEYGEGDVESNEKVAWGRGVGLSGWGCGGFRFCGRGLGVCVEFGCHFWEWNG